MLAVYDGRDQEAVALLMASLATFPGPRSTLDLPITKRLALRADFQTALRALDATLSDQRLQVVRLLCGPDRISPSWQPAPETCTRLTLAP